jgi:hypothetical protein
MLISGNPEEDDIRNIKNANTKDCSPIPYNNILLLNRNE